MLPDPEKVVEIIRHTAATLITPRFRRLRDDQVYEKSPGDLVTVADTEAEQHLKAELTALVPGSVAVGEEEAEKNAAIIGRIYEKSPVWVIDPVDGTRNFVHGRRPFAVIVAYCLDAETRFGWIHDPISDETLWAAKGQGCRSGSGHRRRLEPPPPVGDMKGSLSPAVAGRMKSVAGGPRRIGRAGCVGRDYMDLALGRLHFARYAFRLKPWDHAAGVLIHSEAGGVNLLLKAGKEYHPGLKPEKAEDDNEVLMLAADRASLDELRAMLKE